MDQTETPTLNGEQQAAADGFFQFLLGPDQDHVAVRTLEGLFNEFDKARRAREAELNTKYASKIS